MSNPSQNSVTPLSRTGRWLILFAAFFGWLLAGFQLQITSLAMRSASMDLLRRTGKLDLETFLQQSKIDKDKRSDTVRQKLKSAEANISRWYSFCVCAFLFGAAAGGFVFGRLGDRIGRAKAMSAAILCYSLLSAGTYYVQAPWQLLAMRFLTCMGVGGMWPNGVALVSEAWSNLSRPMIAGIIGTAANVGIFIMATIGKGIDADHWRWVMLVGASPVILGVLVLILVPESPRWLATRHREITETESTQTSTSGVFQPPLLKITIVGILLATVPLMGGWGVANWMMPWAGKAGEELKEKNTDLKSQVGQARSFTGSIGSLLGGWIASRLGRKRAYFFTCLIALFFAQYTFWFKYPTDRDFLFWVSGLGLFSGIFFGWLPLFLPELFPTRARSTGAGVSFNFGRILTAFSVLAAGTLSEAFGGDYARIGRVTSLIYALGLVVIWFAPDTSKSQLED